MTRVPVLAIACCSFALAPARAAEPVFAEQGWSPDQRREAYRTPIGSQLLPRDWFLALEEPFSNKPLRDPDYLEQFGFLRTIGEQGRALNPIPFGFTEEPGAVGRRDFIGVNCALCHTAQIEFRGAKLRIDGAPAKIDYLSFVEAIVDALHATARDKAKMARFAERVLGENPAPAAQAKLRDEVRAYAERLGDFAARGRPMYPAGFGRLDALGMLTNGAVATSVGIPDNYRVPAAPAKYMRLWLAPKLDWLQWNGGVQNPAVRNLVEGLGGFGHLEVRGTGKDVSFHTTSLLEGGQKIWDRLDELQAPKWPEGMLGKIDPERAAAGAKVYTREGCASCHAQKPPYPLSPANKQGKQFIAITKTPISKVGTDPGAATEFVVRSALTGRMATILGGKETVAGTDMFFAIAGLTTQARLAEAKLPAAELQRLNGYRDPVIPTRDELLSYKAAPLAGAWSTGPYLHNGSVPSLYHLLLPADKRPKRFHVGSREFDPKHVGFDSAARDGTFLFDTSVPGNSNAGHEYGTTITDDERWALVEYLKTL